MAIDQGTETLAILSQERTWRINIETAEVPTPIVTTGTAEIGGPIAAIAGTSRQEDIAAAKVAG